MTKLGTKSHIHAVYFRGRDYILTEEMENEQVGLQLLKWHIITNWEIILELMEDSDAN